MILIFTDSRGNKPRNAFDDFIIHMDIYNEIAGDFPDGAWFCFMEAAAQQYLDDNKLRCNGDTNDMVHSWTDRTGDDE